MLTRVCAASPPALTPARTYEFPRRKDAGEERIGFYQLRIPPILTSGLLPVLVVTRHYHTNKLCI